MSQGDQSIANQAGAAFRSDLNAELQALVSNSSGASAPSTTYADQFYVNTTTGIIYMRNAANAAWIEFGVRGYGWGVPRGHIAGLTLSNNGTATKLDVAAGVCRDSTDTATLYMPAAITAGLIQTSGSWAAGSTQNKLDTGARANSTWYHVWIIRKDSDGTVDWLFSLSASSPTMPSGYTYKRRIGSVKTDGSGNITSFTQVGDEFLWLVATQDVSAANPGTAAVTRTLNVPTGVVVYAKGYWITNNNGAVVNFDGIITALDITDTAPNRAGAAGINIGGNCFGGASGMSYCQSDLTVRTNTSGQVRSRMMASDASCTLYANTYGWIDTRGRMS